MVELGEEGRELGPDLVTLPPDLLNGLRRREGIRYTSGSQVESPTIEFYPKLLTYLDLTDQTTTSFERALKDDRLTLDKVPEGLEKFSKEARVLEARVVAALLEVLGRENEQTCEVGGETEHMGRENEWQLDKYNKMLRREASE